ncbi:MAG TPA: phospho-sugar mutase [Chthoniobacterales bacterium]|nr:phospho-sugar mutase [Chthoniobacterales bacterium]
MARTLGEKIEDAVSTRRLLETTGQNIALLLGGATSSLYAQVVTELVETDAWDELNDRFYKTLAFGTGGLRGRTIGKVVTDAERGTPDELGRPEFPCVGTNAMNFYNISRATQGLMAYLHDWFRNERVAGRPKIVIAHDTRHFSNEFAQLTAQVAAENGCDAYVFDGPRSTPELSFAVRHLQASAGIVITASHNPPHDNGYKVYFNDGAQVVEPHASGIIAKVNLVEGETYAARGDAGAEVITLGAEIDDEYMRRLESLVLDRDLVRSATDLRIVFTPIHGTGGVIIKPILERLGFGFSTVAEQDQFDGRFPTVKSPNPENAEALKLGVELAIKQNGDVVIATDPDCDRMGVAVRTAQGEMKLLTGNQIGSLMAWYRARTLFEQRVLNAENAARGVIIKTFVTTDLQKAIAEHFGLRCVETLTGFKYIGAKLGKYERMLPEEVRGPYRELPEEETRRLRLEHSSLYVFGGEESYGYSGGDFVRDKDGNGAVIMFCEVAAYARSRGLTLDALLDEIYATFGYFEERNGALTYEGAEGAAKIRRLLESYVTAAPVEMLGSRVVAVKDFEKETFCDAEGDTIPKEKMLIFELEDRTRIAVRGSGTEPKIKYYLFAQRTAHDGQLSQAGLAGAKIEVATHLDSLWNWLQQDAAARLGA